MASAIDGFDFLGWHFKVQSNGKFKCVPSVDNFKAFRKKVKAIVNNSNYGSKVKAEKLAPLIRGWRNYHKFCKMDGLRNSLHHIKTRAYTVFNKETKQNRYSSKKLLDKAFPAVPYSENNHNNVKGTKSPYDGDRSVDRKLLKADEKIRVTAHVLKLGIMKKSDRCLSSSRTQGQE